MKIRLYLLGYKAYCCLKAILDYECKTLLLDVVVARDKNVIDDYYEQIVLLCNSHGILIHKRGNVVDSVDMKDLVHFAIGWRWIIDTKNPLIVLHDSLLPKYRGFAPLVNMLINAEPRIGVTALYANNSFDEGDIIAQSYREISYPIKIQSAIDKVSKCYVEISTQIFQNILDLERLPDSVPQVSSQATYSLWREYEDYFINWSDSSDKIKRFIDAVGYPYLGAKSYIGETIISIDDVEVLEDKHVVNRDVGKVLFFDRGFPCVVCGEGILKITKLRGDDNSSLLPLRKFRTRFK